MNAIELTNWDSFEPELEKLREEFTLGANDRCPYLLFRGQSDSDWQLTTTQGASGSEPMSIAAYYQRVVTRVKPAVGKAEKYSVALERSFRTESRALLAPRFSKG